MGAMAPWAPAVQPNIELFVRGSLLVGQSPIAFRMIPMRGGLVSPLVQHVSVRYADARGRHFTSAFVVKELLGDSLREIRVYEVLAPHKRGLAPELVAVDEHSTRSFLYLESVHSKRRWPWKDLSLAERVLEKLAQLHCLVANHQALEWDYDAELRATASATLSEVLRFTRMTGDRLTRVALPALRRLVEHLPMLRRQLLGFVALPATLIHGDVHPGNVVVRGSRRGDDPLFVDWARARLGSPLEDVNSWIEWLAFWEYGAMRKHDSLLSAYLRARGLPCPATMSLRDAYWTAGAVNCMSGALAYHLGRATPKHANQRERAAALRAVHHCLRIVRRADRCAFSATAR